MNINGQTYFIDFQDNDKHFEFNNKNYSKWLNKLTTAINKGKYQLVKSLTQSEFFMMTLQQEPEVIYNKVISTQNLRLFNYFLGHTSQFNADFMRECVIKNFFMDGMFYVEYEFDKDGNIKGEKFCEFVLRDKPYSVPISLSKFIEYSYSYDKECFDFLLRNCSKYLVNSSLLRYLPVYLIDKPLSICISYIKNLHQIGILTKFDLSDWDYLIEHNRFDIIKFLVEEMDFEIVNEWCHNFDGNWSYYNDYGVDENDTIFEIPLISFAYKNQRYDIIKYILDHDPNLKKVLSYDTLILHIANFELFKILISDWDDVDANKLITIWNYHSNSTFKLNHILDNFNIITNIKFELLMCQWFTADKMISDNKRITNDTFEIVYRLSNELENHKLINKGKNPLANKERTILYYKTYYSEKNGSLDGFEKHMEYLGF